MYLTFELRYRKEAYHKVRGKLERLEERDRQLRDIPPDFSESRGAYNTISAIANRLNQAQLRAGFLDYLYFPEVCPPIGANA